MPNENEFSALQGRIVELENTHREGPVAVCSATAAAVCAATAFDRTETPSAERTGTGRFAGLGG